MSVTKDQQQLVGLIATQALFQRDPNGSTRYPMLNFGTLKASATPNVANEKLKIEDYFNCGITLHEEVTDLTESYVVQTQNISPLNLAMYFAAEPPGALTQTVTPVTDVVHADVVVGGYIQIETAGAAPVFDVDTVDGVTLDPGGTDTVLVAWNGTTGDYHVVDAERGLIRLVPGGAAALTDGDVVTISIDYTLNAITGNRVIVPQKATTIEGACKIYYRSNCGDQQMVRDCRASVSANAANFQQSGTDSSDLSFDLTVIGDLTADEPAGKFYYYKGTVPTNMPALPTS